MLEQLKHQPLTPSDAEWTNPTGPSESIPEMMRTTSGRPVRTVQEELSDAVDALGSCVEVLKIIQRGIEDGVIPNLSFKLGKGSDIIIPERVDPRQSVILSVVVHTALAMAGCES